MKRSTLYGHLLILKARAALQWRAVGSKTVIVSFPDAEDKSINLDKPNLVLDLSTTNIEPKTKTKATPVQKSKNLDSAKVYPVAQLLAEFSHIQLDANKGRLLGEAKLFVKLNPFPTIELLRQHYNGDKASFWWTQDWRGQKGQKPTLFAIRETWGQWVDTATKPKGISPEEAELGRQLAEFKAKQNANPV